YLLLGHHVPLHVGGLAPPALHGAATMGADAWHDVLADAADPVLGFGGQRAADAQWRLAQGARRCDAALHDDRCRVLWRDNFRGIIHGDPLGQLSLPLHRLDHWTRPRRRAWLGRHDHLRFDLLARALAMEARGHVFGTNGRSPF